MFYAKIYAKVKLNDRYPSPSLARQFSASSAFLPDFAFSSPPCYNKTAMDQVIPARLLTFPQIPVFMAYLRHLPLDPEDKKQLLLHWCDRVGYKITPLMLRLAGIN